jgi:DNA-binding NarL/FixJ family response regulator
MPQTMKPQPKERIRILVVEDHFLIRIGLTTALQGEPDMVIVAEAEDGEEALEAFRRHRPDVVLLDLRLPGRDGIEVIEAMRKEFGPVALLVLSSQATEQDIDRAMQAGASGYLLKGMSFQKVVEGIRVVQGGGRYFPPEIISRLSERDRHSKLSSREMRVLERIAAGKTNKEIGNELGIVEGTVKIHVSNLLNKLGVLDRTQAVMTAIKRGLLKMQ